MQRFNHTRLEPGVSVELMLFLLFRRSVQADVSVGVLTENIVRWDQSGIVLEKERGLVEIALERDG